MQASKPAIGTAMAGGKRRTAGRLAWLKQDLLAYAFLAPALIGLLLYIAVPLISGLYLSFTRYAGVGSATRVGMRNYRYAAAMLWVLGAILLVVSLLRLGIGEHGFRAEREG